MIELLKINKEKLMELYEKNVLNANRKELKILTMGEVIDKLQYNQIAVQYVEKKEAYLEYLKSHSRVTLNYLYFDEKDFRLMGGTLDPFPDEVVTIVKHLSEPIVKLVILDLIN